MLNLTISPIISKEISAINFEYNDKDIAGHAVPILFCT